MKPVIRRCCAALLSLFLLFGCVGCGNPAPALEDVRDEFQALMEASVEVNDIFFGKGLPVYDRETSSGDGNLTYDKNSGLYYTVLEDETYVSVLKYYDSEQKKNVYAAVTEKAYRADEIPSSGLFVREDGEIVLNRDGAVLGFRVLPDYTEPVREYVYDESSPAYYDYVRLDAPYQTVGSIKELAEQVYSAKYLESVYVTLFDGLMLEGGMIYARYMTDESGNTDFLLKYNKFVPYFEEQTAYDFSTMKMVQPSNGNSVNVEIEAEGNYIDEEQKKVVRGKLTKTIRFVKEADGWRLDTPTY